MQYSRFCIRLSLLILSVSTCARALGQEPSSATSSQQPAVSQTQAEQQLRRWLETFNAGDRVRWHQFVAQYFPSKPPQEIDREVALRSQTGGLDLFKVEQATSTTTVALLKERDSETRGIRATLAVEGTAPHHIERVVLQFGVPLPVTIARLNQGELIKALRGKIDELAAADRFAGAVLIAKNESPIFRQAYGLADRDWQTRNKIDTRFRIGSMGKMFTAVAVLQLVQEGKIALDAPFGKYLPDYPNKTLASQVTIHQLLTHTGGTGDVFGPQLDAHRNELRTHQDYVKLFGARDPLFEPGSRWMYSNYGFILLGTVIERVSGQDYYDYVRDHVYGPAGMKSTGSMPEDHEPSKRAVGYTKAGGVSDWRPNTDKLPYRGTAAGGGYSTVQDLMRFANALMTHKLLNAEHTRLLTSGKVDALGGKYAYGFIERISDGVRSFGHGGNAEGMNGDLVIFPDTGYIVVVLANMDRPAADRISEFVVNRLPRH